MSDAHDFEARSAALTERHLRPRAVGKAIPSTARGIHHLALICSDADRTMAFYQDVLGFPLVELIENRDYPGSAHFFFDLGHDNLLAFFDFPGLDLPPWVETLGSMQHVAISVTRANFDAARARLDAEGIDYFGGNDEIPNSVYFQGPDRERIELLADPLREVDGRVIP